MDTIEWRLRNLIDGAQEGIDNTYKWERRNNKTLRVSTWFLAFDIFVLAFILFVSEPHPIRVGLIILALVLGVSIIRMNVNHHKWILETRKQWRLESLHWQAAKIEYQETGQIGVWAFQFDHHYDT